MQSVPSGYRGQSTVVVITVRYWPTVAVVSRELKINNGINKNIKQ